MRAAHSWLGPDGQCASIAGSRGVFCEKGLHGPVAADPQGDSCVQQLACEEDRSFSRYLLNRAGRDFAAADEQKPERPLRLSDTDHSLQKRDVRVTSFFSPDSDRRVDMPGCLKSAKGARADSIEYPCVRAGQPAAVFRR